MRLRGDALPEDQCVPEMHRLAAIRDSETMTTDEFIQRVAGFRRRIKALREDNERLRVSRQEWKTKHRSCARENTALRRRVRQLEESRDMWRTRAPRPSVRANRPNVQLRPGDLDVILRMRCRD